ncbi:hypothetical protein KL951_001420 [Ogataea haglerorum]|nr:hypothetical protein KL951_001420 [Ogataea haglerorum]
MTSDKPVYSFRPSYSTLDIEQTPTDALAIQRSISSLRNQGQMVGFDEENEAIVGLAVKVNTVTNVVLLASKDAIVFFTRSASTTASLVKSALGLLCTFVRVFFNKYASSQSAQFRNERTRLEPLGLLVLSMIIIILFVRVLQEAVNRLYGACTRLWN